MNIQQYIVDSGLFNNNKKLKNIVESSFETVVSLLRTVKEYREFAQPGMSTWDEYVLEIFHVFGFSSQKIGYQEIVLSDMPGDGSPLAILHYIKPENEANDFSNSKWVDNYPVTFNKIFADWGIITDGFTIKIHDLRLNEPQNEHLLINFEAILNGERSDSFLYLTRIFKYIRTIEDLNDKHISEVDFSGLKNQDYYSGPHKESLAHYIKIINELKIQKNKKYWSQKTFFGAPHKPLLLLAFLVATKHHKINSLEVRNILRSVDNTYGSLWEIIYPDKNNPGIASPFLRMIVESFWQIHPGVDHRLRDSSTIDDLLELCLSIQMNKEFYELLSRNDSWIVLFNTILNKYFDVSVHDELSRFVIESFDEQVLPPGLRKESYLDKKDEEEGYKTGYLELTSHPPVPPQKIPTKNDCQGYEYISMVQLCNIAQFNNRTRRSACRAFGGDNGDLPVIPSRQTRVSYGHKPWKFVIVAAVEKYFSEEGIDW
jgi:hypothetical protein